MMNFASALPSARFLLLPPCFPSFRVGGGEAKTAPKGRS